MSTTPTAQPLRPGIEVNFAGHLLTVPPLHRLLWKKHASTSFKQLGDLEGQIQGKEDMAAADQAFDLQCAVVLDALRLNYGNLTQDEFDGMFDVVSMQAAFPAAMGDMNRARSAVAKNAQAVSPSGPSTGMPTPPASLPAPDGDSVKFGI